MKPYQKSLRARTIVPDDLYVDRDADRQLNDIVDEMGRPGYILVARQMGKTNLLLRMKRRREALGEIAVYIDLSIGFSDARSLFRHLIDSLLEVQAMDDVRPSIEQDRQETTLDPSVEYDRHLRRVLGVLNKDRMILILDEIDSLVGQPYSDRILSQVRSMYFARANFPIYERLTYVLSGVAEPTDLIKDKNISPFNIGEKVYLNDFSRTEVSMLLRNAGIELNLDIQEAVYGWTSGNPRMTWDVYSALEDAMAASEIVGISTVNAIIQKLYLDRYDRAPLDHIRALAENDPEVRAALVALLYGKGDTLDDRSRSKLYLAGITTASANEAPSIKNKVIESALSENWLAQVEAGRKGLLTAATRRYTNGAYSEAIELFNQFINSGGALEALDDLELLQYGMALYHIGDYAEAATTLERAIKQSRSSEIRAMLNYHLALSVMLLGRVDESIAVLKPLSEVSGLYRLRALHALGTAYLKMSIKENAQQIIDINNTVLDETASDLNLTENDKSEIISAAHYNLGQVFVAQKRLAEAKVAFELANSAAASKTKPAFASARLQAANNADEREAILVEVCEILFRENVPYSTANGMLGFDQSDMAELMAIAIDLEKTDLFKQLLLLANERSATGSFETLVSLATMSDEKGINIPTRSLLAYALTDPSITQEALLKQRLNAATIWLARSNDTDRSQAFDAYWKVVSEQDSLEFLSANDTVALANQVGIYLKDGKLESAKQIMRFVRRNEETLAAASKTMFAFFVYQEMVVHRMEENYENLLISAREVLSLVPAEGLSRDMKEIQHSALVEQLRLAARNAIATIPVKPKFARNEYINVLDRKTGIVSRVKYKKVSDHIAMGTLEIVSEGPSTIMLQQS